jgi:transposase
MGTDQKASAAPSGLTQGRSAACRRPRVSGGDSLGAAQRRPLEGSAARPRLAFAADLLASAGALGTRRGVAAAVECVPRRAGRERQARLERVLRRRDLRVGKKGGLCVGPTKRGKGTKLVVVVDGAGVPLACTVHSASPSETKMIEPTLDRLPQTPKRLILDRAYDSEAFRDRLAARGIEPIVPYRKRAVSMRYNDRRKQRRYRKRWKIERTFAWLGNFRRLLVRHEHKHWIWRAFVHLACVLIVLRQF